MYTWRMYSIPMGLRWRRGEIHTILYKNIYLVCAQQKQHDSCFLSHFLKVCTEKYIFGECLRLCVRFKKFILIKQILLLKFEKIFLKLLHFRMKIDDTIITTFYIMRFRIAQMVLTKEIALWISVSLKNPQSINLTATMWKNG